MRTLILTSLLLLTGISLSLAQNDKEEIKKLREQINHLEAQNKLLSGRLNHTENNFGSWMDYTDEIIKIIDGRIKEASMEREKLDNTLRAQIIHEAGIAASRSNQIFDRVKRANLYLSVALVFTFLLALVLFIVNRKQTLSFRKQMVDYTNSNSDSLYMNLTEKIESKNEQLRENLLSEMAKNAEKQKGEITSENRKVADIILKEQQKLDEKLVSLIESRTRELREEKMVVAGAGSKKKPAL